MSWYNAFHHFEEANCIVIREGGDMQYNTEKRLVDIDIAVYRFNFRLAFIATFLYGVPPLLTKLII